MRDNHLINESSPYLQQHAHQPVDWYPWCNEAFEKAQAEDKPVFLSIGYSTCHWCHVMSEESFSDDAVAAQLNSDYISIKVDREERPDIDNVYMAVCQAMTGSGGWPMSIFMTPDRKPFFAGTYFPKDSRGGAMGFRRILRVLAEKWREDRETLLRSADEAVEFLSQESASEREADDSLLDKASDQFERSFDPKCGGFGPPPKFPIPHNILFLLDQYKKKGDRHALHMAEVTLKHMYRGGIFDHIGFGFSRYSVDRAFQIPHFEKMLYDNALLIMSYAKAFALTGNEFYFRAAEQTADYLLREIKDSGGAFYSAQDADSDGVEGRFYLFTPDEICRVLGEERGAAFNLRYNITEQGNFEGLNIPHLGSEDEPSDELADTLAPLRDYRKKRSKLHLDDKILTAWNSLAIAAFAWLYRVSRNEAYLRAAVDCEKFIRSNLYCDDRLFVSFRGGKRGCAGFLNEYAFFAFALLELGQATQDGEYFNTAQKLCRRAILNFWDDDTGGFHISGTENESLILRQKETYDGAMPSGNSVMAHNLVRLSQLTEDPYWANIAQRQLRFMAGHAADVPMGHSFFLLALSAYLTPPERIVVVPAADEDISKALCKLQLGANITLCREPTHEYKLLGGKTTYYVCTADACLPPTNEMPKV